MKSCIFLFLFERYAEYQHSTDDEKSQDLNQGNTRIFNEMFDGAETQDVLTACV
jgi:hypothetical protein